uniref:Uncharacterized protein n=1 Tax=Timema cristinae TaxID=61476 RepID=A0A7R9GT64_TIMCR|nr:unnamed protein product [Timema cristinae]
MGGCGGGDERRISADLWFLAVVLEKSPHRLLKFLRHELELELGQGVRVPGQTVLSRYLAHYNFVEMHLDSVFKYGEVATLPPELFKCRNVRVLSLKYNNLEWIPPDVGRMSALERLSLTNNRLQNQSIPFTLTFCRRLTELYLDNNLLDALPGFLLAMPQLCTVHRHGNHNYFKATFMWYHTDVNERGKETAQKYSKRKSFTEEIDELKATKQRLQADVDTLTKSAGRLSEQVETTGNLIFVSKSNSFIRTAREKTAALADINKQLSDRVLRVCGVAQKGKQQVQTSKHPDTLVLLAARAVMASKCDFFQPDLLPVAVQDYIAHVYPSFNVCGNCPTVTPLAAPGYKVYTFKNPYLGNTCVPFQHWACSLACAKQIEVPAHMEQMRAAERMDREYNHYIQEFQVEPRPPLPSRGLCALV